MDANIDPRLQEPGRPQEPTSSVDVVNGSVPGLRPSRSDYQPPSGLQGHAPAPSLSPLVAASSSTVGGDSFSSLLTAIELEAGWARPSNAPAPSHSPLVGASSTVVGDSFCPRLTVGKRNARPSDYRSPPALLDPAPAPSLSPFVAASSTVKNLFRLTWKNSRRDVAHADYASESGINQTWACL